MFLGHVITLKLLKVNFKKVEAIESKERPKTASEVQSFLGLVGCYRHFVEEFSKIALDPFNRTHKEGDKI